MKLNYINIVANNSIWVINRISNLLRKRNYSIQAFSAAFDEKWYWHIIVGIQLEEGWKIDQVISQVYKLFDVKKVIDMWEEKEKIQFLFNVNCNCKKTLKKISKKPDTIIETKKELIYTFMIQQKEKKSFMQELWNLKLPYVQRIIWLTES